MPSENSNPWSGELKAKRQKSKGKSDPRSPPVRVPISEPFLPKSPAKDLGQPVTIKSNELDGKKPIEFSDETVKLEQDNLGDYNKVNEFFGKKVKNYVNSKKENLTLSLNKIIESAII